MNEFPIPEKYLSCPMMVTPMDDVARYERVTDEIIVKAVSDDVDEKARMVHGLLADMNQEVAEAITSETLADAIREYGGNLVELINARISEVQKSMAAHAMGCFGPAVLHGEKNRRIFDATVCASPRMEDDTTELAVVKRTRA